MNEFEQRRHGQLQITEARALAMIVKMCRDLEFHTALYADCTVADVVFFLRGTWSSTGRLTSATQETHHAYRTEESQQSQSAQQSEPAGSAPNEPSDPNRQNPQR